MCALEINCFEATSKTYDNLSKILIQAVIRNAEQYWLALSECISKVDLAVMAPINTLSHLLNPLATSSQLETSASQLDGISKQLEDSVRFETGRLVQVVGVLLRLPQELIAKSLIILYRFWIGPDGGSMLEYDPKVRRE
nr:hypothetical protein CFP56_21839 [Quercus suber]